MSILEKIQKIITPKPSFYIRTTMGKKQKMKSIIGCTSKEIVGIMQQTLDNNFDDLGIVKDTFKQITTIEDFDKLNREVFASDAKFIKLHNDEVGFYFEISDQTTTIEKFWQKITQSFETTIKST